MTTSEFLSWPGKQFPAVLTDDGLAHAELAGGLEFGFDPPIDRIAELEHRGLALVGERLACMRALLHADLSPLTLAYLDVPRLAHAPFANQNLRVSTWLSAIRSHAEAAAALLKPAGRIIIHVDDEGAALAMAALDDLFGASNRETTILWQKKYGPQNDLRGRIDDAQDYLLVYTTGARVRESRLESAWWPHQYAGKSEDATREAEQLRQDGVISLSDIPKTSKPTKLIDRLLDAFTDPGDYVLECFSDTGFASAAAASKGRIPVLLTGDTGVERDRFERCSLPRLEHAFAGKGGVMTFVLHAPGYALAKVGASGAPVELRLSTSAPRVRELRPILIEDTGASVVPSARGGFPSLAIDGPASDVLVALEPAVSCDVTLAHFAWSSPPPPEEVELQLTAAARLLDKKGVVAISVDPSNYATIRLIGEMRVFGRSHYMGTIAIEDRASPKLVVLFKGLPEARLGKIGLPKERKYDASDGDPRGPWRDPGHKGARSGGPSTAFEFRLPPYRWEVLEGDLPPGVWRLNPISGVIWANCLERAGTFRFKVRVTDSVGRSSDAECTIEVSEFGQPHYPKYVWWMERFPNSSDGPPRIITQRLPAGVLGEPYSAVLEATGGKPITELTAPGESTVDGRRTRYWEFARDTLVAAMLEDRVLFGATGQSKPRIKKYLRGATSSGDIAVELSWWGSDRLSGQTPVERLLTMLTQSGDLVLIVDGDGHSDALRNGRRCIRIASGSHGDRFPFAGRLGNPVATWDSDRRSFRPHYDSPDFEAGLPWLLGFLPPSVVLAGHDVDTVDICGITADASEAVVMLSPMEWLTRSRCEALARRWGQRFGRLQVLYYRGKPPRGIPALRFRRVPFDLLGAI